MVMSVKEKQKFIRDNYTKEEMINTIIYATDITGSNEIYGPEKTSDGWKIDRMDWLCMRIRDAELARRKYAKIRKAYETLKEMFK